MAGPKNKPEIPKYPKDVLARHHQLRIFEIEKKGLVVAANGGGVTLVIGGYVRFTHPESDLHVWISRLYVRVFNKTGGKITDSRWFAVTDGEEISRLVDQELSRSDQPSQLLTSELVS